MLHHSVMRLRKVEENVPSSITWFDGQITMCNRIVLLRLHHIFVNFALSRPGIPDSSCSSRERERSKAENETGERAELSHISKDPTPNNLSIMNMMFRRIERTRCTISETSYVSTTISSFFISCRNHITSRLTLRNTIR